jgi:hypothetical protein
VLALDADGHPAAAQAVPCKGARDLSPVAEWTDRAVRAQLATVRMPEAAEIFPAYSPSPPA